MKKLNLKQPKYIFPLVILLPLTALAYTVSSMFEGSSTNQRVATDSLNTTLPDADAAAMKDKMAAMDDRYDNDDAYSAVNGFKIDSDDKKDSLNNGYSESELDQIDKDNAARKEQEEAQREMERSLAMSRAHINSYSNNSGSSARGSRGSSYDNRGSGSSRRDELDDYAKELEYIQKRSLAAQRAIDRGVNGDYGYGDVSYSGNSGYDGNKDDILGGYGATSSRKGAGTNSKIKKTELVRKVQSKNASHFNTISGQKDLDAPLIKAMIDKTTKAHEGTRLRFKLLDDVTVNKTLLKKGTYLYGLVTGFGQQRVKANITSILVGNRFLKVNLSVYDNDGMEGFYVPESAFRDMMRDAGAQAMQSNIQFDNGSGGSSLRGETVALQALQNVYQSASSAVSANMRKNKARIKYNTIVYLINSSENAE